MFGFGKKKELKIEYDSSSEEPALKTSICTGEKVAGFVDISTRKFRDVMLIKNDAELEVFCSACGIDSSELKHIV